MGQEVLRPEPEEYGKYQGHQIRATDRKRRVTQEVGGRQVSYDALIFGCGSCATEGTSSEMEGALCPSRDRRLIERRRKRR